MIHIRPASAEDEACIAGIIRASMLASYALFLPAHQFQKILDMDRPAQVARESGPRFSMAQVHGVPAGALLLKEDYVDHLWVRPEFMGRGVGSALLDHAVDRARRAGFDRLTLDCLARNEKALAFYRAKGFALERVYVAATYLVGENVCLMAKALATD
ncbi:GNAT family N-acetyltransferase [Pseudodesulfovibrio karagichevae]|uniref:N-acetyltransferase family protein n=1 Tax=Pseudodesulfovibrio karagichevae TaxID=3239305 RepID=A0ABV4K413_9BACT